MRKFLISFRRQGIVTPSLSDLVALGILTKPISEFTNDDIGTEVSIPYTDAGGVISGPIVFEVVGVNHHISEEHQQTITLMTKNIIRYAAFDAMEPNNTDSERANWGNNRWSVSNIRQWLNSSGAANEWFTAQHEYDEAPTTDKVYNESSASGAYADKPGFLAGFSADIIQHFTDITNTTALCYTDGGGSETTVDKVFLPSYTEMGYGNNNSVAEGSHLSIKFTNNDSRIKSGTNYGWYWMRSPLVDFPCFMLYVNDVGDDYDGSPYIGDYGLTPLVVLH